MPRAAKFTIIALLLCAIVILAHTVRPAGTEQQAWVAHYNGPGHDFDGADAIRLDKSGNVYVTGESIGLGTGADYITIKYNSSGEQQWVARYDGGPSDAATALAVESSGNVYVTGQSWSAKTSNYDYATVSSMHSDRNNGLPDTMDRRMTTIIPQELPWIARAMCM